MLVVYRCDWIHFIEEVPCRSGIVYHVAEHDEASIADEYASYLVHSIVDCDA